MPQPWKFVLLPALAIASFGCREPSQGARGSDSPEGPATLFASDSASLDIVRISNLDALDPPQVTRRPVYSTAAPSSSLQLYNIAGAVFLADSSLVIAHKGSSELIFLDRDGNVRGRTGREGEGPGEYIDMARIGTGPDGTLFVYDGRARRFTLLDSRGGVTDVEPVGRTGEMVPLTHLKSGEFLAVLETRPSLPPGLQRGPLFLVRGDYSWDDLDTLGRWAGKERHVTPDRAQWIQVGFGATALYAGRGPYTVVGTNDSLDLTLYEGASPLTRIRGGYSPDEVTTEEKEAWMELMLETFGEEHRPDQRRRLERSTVRESYPAFGALKVDAEGRIWIGAFAKLGERQRRWTILGPDGRLIGALALPLFRPELIRVREGSITGYAALEHETTIPSPRHELLDVAAGRVAILRRDEFGVEFIEVYEVDVPR